MASKKKKISTGKFTIYSIWQEDTCVYIGCSQRNNIEVRWNEHKKQLKEGNHPTKKLQKLYNENPNFTYKVEMEVPSESNFLMFICEGLWNSVRKPLANGIVIKKFRINIRLSRIENIEMCKDILRVIAKYCKNSTI